MSSLGRCAATGLLLFAALFSGAANAPPVCAAEGPRAVLVVDTGESEQRFCVALPDDEVSGLELIALAGEQHGLSYRFGFGGEAVCMLAGVGPTGDDCFEDYPDFWGYWRGDASGGWSWSGSGAGSTTVQDGDVEGWSWGSGSDGDTHPRPPDTAYDSVCPAAAQPREQQPRPRAKPSRRGDAEAPAAQPRSDDDRRSPVATSAHEQRQREVRRHERRNASERSANSRRKRQKERERRDARRSPDSTGAGPRPSAGPTTGAEIVAPPLRPTGSSGPPPAGLAALGAAALLGGAGFVLARRRRSTSPTR